MYRNPATLPYRLIRATDRDRRWLDQLWRSVYRDLFIATFGRWDETRHLRHIRECWDRGQISIIQFDGEPIGMIQLLDHPEAIEIGELQIQPAHQGMGIGTRILRDVIQRAHKRGKNVTLSVALKNERAAEFYRRVGFEQVGRTDTHNELKCAHS